jgi:hypothetical protein
MWKSCQFKKSLARGERWIARGKTRDKERHNSAETFVSHLTRLLSAHNFNCNEKKKNSNKSVRGK